MYSTPDVPEISPLELARAIESGESVQLLDVRPAPMVESGRIDIVPDDRFLNIVGSQLMSIPSLDNTPLDPDVPVTVVCAHGISSQHVTQRLNELGGTARSLTGGMAAWMMTTLPRELTAIRSLDRLIHFDRIGKGALGYLLISNGEALIIDPPMIAESFLDAAEDLDAKIVGVADTHVHADYISGGPAMVTELGIPYYYYLHSLDGYYPYDGTPGRIEFTGLENGSTIRFGRCTVECRHTPGHTDGSTTYTVDGEAAFTGEHRTTGGR